MNDQLQAALVAILGKTTDALSAGVSFLSAQLPDVIQQLLLWKLTFSAVSCVTATIGFIVWFVLLLKAWRYTGVLTARRENQYDKETCYPEFFLIATPVSGAVLFTLFELFNLQWLQILVAPKIFLIEYAASLAR